MDAAARTAILARYADHVRRFDEVASRRGGDDLPLFERPRRGVRQEPTEREIVVLQLISEGLTNREIGEQLLLSEETVKVHIRHLFSRLGVRSRAHAVAVGFRRRIIA